MKGVCLLQHFLYCLEGEGEGKGKGEGALETSELLHKRISSYICLFDALLLLKKSFEFQ